MGFVLMDLSKAFDCLPHRRLLLCKLRKYGVSPHACQLIRSYLSNRKQRVKIWRTWSDWLNISKGVPRGSVFGRCTETAIQMRTLCKQIRPNTSKFQATVMTSGTNDTSFTINVFDNDLSPSTCVKMLVLHIDYKLHFEKQISICSRASNHIHVLNGVSNFFNEEVKIELNNTFVLSSFFVLLHSLAFLL